MHKNNIDDNENFYTDEIDLFLILKALWRKKIHVILITTFFMTISLIYAFTLPNKYQSSVLIYPADKSNMNSALSRYGNLASMAGISIPSETNEASIAMEIVKSRLFIENFINKRNILLPLMAAESWDINSYSLIFNNTIYDTGENKWIRKGKTTKPSMQEAYETWMSDVFSYQEDKKTQFVKLTIEHLSPSISQKWASWLIADLNNHIRNLDIDEAELSIKFLEAEVEKTNSEELRSLFYTLIKSETEKKMLAYSRPDYVFRVIDPPVISESKSSPSRKLILVFGLFFGLFAGIIYVLVQSFIIKKHH